MPLSRRTFVRSLGVGGAGALTLPGWLNARGLEAATATGTAFDHGAAQGGAVIKLDSNENPNGPVPAAMRAVQANFRRAALYPSRGEVFIKRGNAYHPAIAAVGKKTKAAPEGTCRGAPQVSAR